MRSEACPSGTVRLRLGFIFQNSMSASAHMRNKDRAEYTVGQGIEMYSSILEYFISDLT